MSFWEHLSNLADVVSMGFAAAMIATGLVFGRAWRAAGIWCGLIGAGMMLVVASKIAYLGWGWGICRWNFTGFSGHATRAMAIAPVFFHLILNRTSLPLQRAGVLLGIAFGFAAGMSRLALHVHSLSEVVAGWLLGGTVALLFIWSGKDQEEPNRQNFELNKFAAIFGILILAALPAPGSGTTQKVLVELSIFLSKHEVAFSRNDCAVQLARLQNWYIHSSF